MIHTEYLSGRDASQRLRDSKQGPAALSRDHDAQTERRTVMPVLRLAAEPVTASDSESVRVRARVRRSRLVRPSHGDPAAIMIIMMPDIASDAGV